MEEDESSSDENSVSDFQGFSDVEINNAVYSTSSPFVPRMGNRGSQSIFNRVIIVPDSPPSPPSPRSPSGPNHNGDDVEEEHLEVDEPSLVQNVGDNEDFVGFRDEDDLNVHVRRNNDSLIGFRLSQLDVYLLRTLGNQPAAQSYINRIFRMRNSNGPSIVTNEDEAYEDIPASHLYLGENLEAMSGRMIFTELRYVNIPIITGYFGPILPGQTFPLTVREFERTEMMKGCKDRDRTFGCLSISRSNTENIYGTTAEIYEYADETGGVCIKAKARQRFKLVNPKSYNLRSDIRMAEVLILPEVKLQHPFDAINSPAFDALRILGKDRHRKFQSSLLPWPKWVYDMYDPEKLVERANKVTFLKQGLRRERGVENLMPQEPSELSFWIANLLDSDQRLFMLKINCPIPRLRWLLSFISKIERYVCANCDVFIAKPTDIFAMSVEGAQSTYVNPDGYHHDTITLLKAESIMPISSPSTHFSWFPGYAWSIAVCQCCQKHLGWQFVSNNKDLWPKKFWGITRNALKTRLGRSLDTPDKPVM